MSHKAMANSTNNREKSYDAIVIGAGVVGLAAAKALSENGQKVLIVESESKIGQGTSSRNSEIIHSGIYYSPGTLRAKLCVAGKHMLYDYCGKRGIRHKRVGKLLVARDEQQVERLKQYLKTGRINDVELQWLEREKVAAIEPKLRCSAAIFSPTTGIVDGQGLMQAFLEDALNRGAVLALKYKVVGGNIKGKRKTLVLQNADTGQKDSVSAKFVVNAAGLHAQTVARCMQERHETIPQQFLAKGNYFQLKGKAPFSHLIYPMPNEAGLGTHLTLGLDDEAKFGPDVQYVDTIEYSVDSSRAHTFYDAIREWWPDLPDNALVPTFSGIRPKLHGPGTKQGDFQIDFDSTQGVVHLYGIESPGLTSSMAIGKLITERLLQTGDSVRSKL